ncbi:MAG: hydrolase, partial [Mesorhizobium sp.]
AFSVAQHSLLVEALYGELVPAASAEARLAALLHDAPEYVIGDMISPFKSVMGGSYKDCELRLQRAIHLRFSLPAELGAPLRKDIKRADQIAAYYEATLLAGFSADRFDITPRSVTWAQTAFLKRFTALEAERQAFLAVNSAT